MKSETADLQKHDREEKIYVIETIIEEDLKVFSK